MLQRLICMNHQQIETCVGFLKKIIPRTIIESAINIGRHRHRPRAEIIRDDNDIQCTTWVSTAIRTKGVKDYYFII